MPFLRVIAGILIGDLLLTGTAKIDLVTASTKMEEANQMIDSTEFKTTVLQENRIIRLQIESEGEFLTFVTFLNLLFESPEFLDSWINTLQSIPFDAFRWETPALTTTSQHNPFECVFINSPGLAPSPEPATFQEHFNLAGDAEEAVFRNLGGDTTLIAPCPIGDPTDYRHLAVFVRRAPEAQVRSFWKRVAMVTKEHIGSVPVWLSTAGAGVYWLHVRLDPRPKYYGHSPYRDC